MTEAEALEVKQRHELRLMEIEGVQGVGLGEDAGRYEIRVYVDRDRPELHERIPPELEHVPVVLEATGELWAQ